MAFGVKKNDVKKVKPGRLIKSVEPDFMKVEVLPCRDGSVFTISLPYAILVYNHQKHLYETVRLSFNNARNWAYLSYNNYKIKYKSLVKDALKELDLGNECYKFVYNAIGNDKQRFDVAGVLCIVDKFMADAIVELGCLKDDDYKNVQSVEYKFSHIDPSLSEKRIILDIFKV